MQGFDSVYAVRDWAKALEKVAYALRARTADTLFDADIGYYADPESHVLAIYRDGASIREYALAKAAAAAVATVRPEPLTLAELGRAAWVKVAYSPTLRAVGETGNFFPGQIAAGIPNSPSPLAAMLTSGLLGAGLGWGGGHLLKKVLPARYGEKLPQTGAILGGLAGAVPGAVWAGANKLTGRDWNDPELLDQAAGAEPDRFPFATQGTLHIPQPGQGDPTAELRDAAKQVVMPHYKHSFDALRKEAVEKMAFRMGRPQPQSPVEVDIDALGRTLWSADASPMLAATTMGAMYAAQQMDDPDSRPGFVTGHQLGELARHAAGDYAKGYLVGAAINAVIGTPVSARSFGAGSAALGVIGAVVPKLFGR